MALSELIDGLEFVNDTVGPDLYYGQYRYKFCIKLVGIHYTRRSQTTEDFDFLIHDTIHWYTMANSKTIAQQLVDNGANIDFLHKFVQWRKLVKESDEQTKIVLSHNCLSVYTNNVTFIENCLKNHFMRVGWLSGHYRNRVENFEKDTVYHVNPKFKYRMYFNYTAFDDDSAKNFIDFVYKHAMTFNPRVRTIIKNGLNSRVRWKYGIGYKQFGIHSNDYVEFDEQSLITVFAILYPSMIRKICDIRPKYK